MDHFEMTEKLREKVNVSYEEAKAALEANDWDLLEAIIYLENRGKKPYNSHENREHEQSTEKHYTEHSRERRMEREEQVSSVLQNIVGFFTKLAKKGISNSLEVYRHDKLLLSIPIIFLVLLLIVGFWFVIPILIIGLFFGLSYRFAGRDINPKVNDAMENVADKAEDLKENIKKKAEDME